MKDIRILRKQFRTKFIKLRFFEINFKFFSKILGKYRNNKYVEKLLDQKIPVVFLFNNIDESILKSVSEILDLLRKKKEEELQENDIINNNEDNSQKITDLNKNKSLYSSFKIRNEYDSPSLTYNYGPNNDKLVETLESIVTNIKKNSKIDEEIKGDKKSDKVSKKQNDIKTARHIKVDKPVVTNKQKKTQAEQMSGEQKHAQSPDGNTDKKVVLNKQLDTQVSEDEVLKKSECTINVEKIKKDIKRFNEEIHNSIGSLLSSLFGPSLYPEPLPRSLIFVVRSPKLMQFFTRIFLNNLPLFPIIILVTGKFFSFSI